MERLTSTERITPLALTDFRGSQKPFGIKESNRRSHIYMLGKTGTGKSTLIKTMLVSDLEQGKGAALIDPHGDLAEAVLDFVPQARLNDVIYFNPADLAYPIAFNPLAWVEPDERPLVASGLIATFKKVWSEFWGPRLEHILRYALLTLLERPGSTLLDLPRLLIDETFRLGVVQPVRQPQIREFWFLEFKGYSAWLKSEAISPILNKVGQFLATSPLRNIFGQRENTFDLRNVLDSGQILIANVAKGRIGEDNASVLGAMLATHVHLAALRRAAQPEDQRRPFYLYVDEVQSFLTLSFAEMLAEARKYGLVLTLAHQYLGQLDERVRAAIMGNVGTFMVFRVGAEDARVLAAEFYPEFQATDLVHLPNHHFYVKLMLNGQVSRGFSALTFSPRPQPRSHRAEIIQISRARYARPRAEVEKDILFRPSLPSASNQRILF